MANRKTTESIVDSVNKLILNTRSSIIAEIDGRRNLAKKITQDRIKRLEEAYLIANQLGIYLRELAILITRKMLYLVIPKAYQRNRHFIYLVPNPFRLKLIF